MPLIKQNENADIVLILNYRHDFYEALGSKLGRMIHIFSHCISKGYYFIFDPKFFARKPGAPGDTPDAFYKFNDFFEAFWDEDLNQKMLDKARTIYLAPDDLNNYWDYSFDHAKVQRTNAGHGWPVYYSFPGISDCQGIHFFCVNKLLKDILTLKPEIKTQILEEKKSLGLDSLSYNALSVRVGSDMQSLHRRWNACPPPHRTYVDVMRHSCTALTNNSNVYVATDGISVLSELKTMFPETNFYSIADKNSNPHTMNNHGDNSIFYALFDFDMCRQAECYVGGNAAFYNLIAIARFFDEKSYHYVGYIGCS